MIGSAVAVDILKRLTNGEILLVLAVGYEELAELRFHDGICQRRVLVTNADGGARKLKVGIEYAVAVSGNQRTLLPETAPDLDAELLGDILRQAIGKKR